MIAHVVAMSTVAHVDSIVGIEAVTKWAIWRFHSSVRPHLVFEARIVTAPVPHAILAPLSVVAVRGPP